jgi:hypothetical protein
LDKIMSEKKETVLEIREEGKTSPKGDHNKLV